MRPRSAHPCAYVVHVFAMRCSACGVRLSPVTHTHSIGVMFSCDVIDARCLKQKVTISCIEKVSPCWRVRNFSCDCDFSSFFLKFQEKLWEISSWRDPEKCLNLNLSDLIYEELVWAWCKFLLNVYTIDCAIHARDDDDGRRWMSPSIPCCVAIMSHSEMLNKNANSFVPSSPNRKKVLNSPEIPSDV